MGMRFRKSASLGGGTKLNISKSGLGISSGVGNVRKSVNSSGRTRTTASAPGTGISFTKERGAGRRKKAGGPLAWIAVALLAFIIITLGSAGSDEDKAQPDSSTADRAVAESVIEQQVETEPAISGEPDNNAPSIDETSVPEGTTEPVQTSQAPESEVITFTPDPEPSEAPTEKATPVYTAPSSQYIYVGSIDSDKYHYPDCRHAKKILSENLVGWDTVDAAKAAGYSPCGVCNPR